jgi:hypothetical protein
MKRQNAAFESCMWSWEAGMMTESNTTEGDNKIGERRWISSPFYLMRSRSTLR